jgi:hypothetical protein
MIFYSLTIKLLGSGSWTMSQAADYHLVTSPETPMGLFSPSFVESLSKKKLEDIAGEEGALKRKRHQLAKKIRDLQEAKKILF